MNYIAIPGLKYKGRMSLATPDHIIQAVCGYFGCTHNELTMRCRKDQYVERRRIAAYLMRELTKMTTMEIGMALGKYDHSSVIYGVKTCKNLMQTEPDFKNRVEMIMDKLHQVVSSKSTIQHMLN